MADEANAPALSLKRLFMKKIFKFRDFDFFLSGRRKLSLRPAAEIDQGTINRKIKRAFWAF